MADPNDNENGEKIQAIQASAGASQRIEAMDEAAAMDVPEPSADDLDARQAAIGELRRSGPPLPDGEDFSDLAMDEAGEVDESTTIAEPRRKDR